MFKRLLESVRKLQIAKYLKPLWKGALRASVDLAIGQAEEEAVRVASNEGPKALDRFIDALQVRLKKAIDGLPLPDGIEQKLIAIVDEQGDAVQARINVSVEMGAPDAVRQAFRVLRHRVNEQIDRL